MYAAAKINSESIDHNPTPDGIVEWGSARQQGDCQPISSGNSMTLVNKRIMPAAQAAKRSEYLTGV
jgi:hypothetical protein